MPSYVDRATQRGRCNGRRFFNALVLLLLFQGLPCGGGEAAGVGPFQWARPNPKVTSIMLVATIVLFVLAFFYVYFRGCIDQRRTPAGAVMAAELSPRRAARGLDAEVIMSFPAFTYSAVKGRKVGKGTLECAVCLNQFNDDETLCLIPKCIHVFHRDCIDMWLREHSTCPVCRADLTPQPGEKVSVQIPAQLQNADPEDGALDPPEKDQANTTMRISRERPTRPVSMGCSTWRIPRCNLTDHAVVQPGENLERFTLRLPEEVRKQLKESRSNQAESGVALPRERSPIVGYRSRSFGPERISFYYDQLGMRVGPMDQFGHADGAEQVGADPSRRTM